MRSISRVAVLLAASALATPAFAQSAPSEHTHALRYDGNRRVVGEISPDPDGAGAPTFQAVRNIYDLNGRLTRKEHGALSSWQSDTIAPANWVGFTVLRVLEYTYDPAGRKLSERMLGSDGGLVSFNQYSYDMGGRLECTAVRLNPAVFGALPESACGLGTAGSQGPDRITRNIYDAAGQLVQVRKAVGTPLEQAYATYSYTPNGKQAKVVDANGNLAELTYDGFDRQARWIFPAKTRPAAFIPATPATALATAGASNAADYEEYSYDANGNRVSLRKRDGLTIAYEYDALNRMARKVIPDKPGLDAVHERSVHYSYDLRGLMTAARFDSPVGEGVTTQYDGFGRITASTLVMDGVSRTQHYCHDANGNRTRMAWPDSTAGACGGVWGNYVSYTYDGLDRPLTVGANAPVWTRTHAYNQRGDLVSNVASGGGGTVTFGRDAIGRVSSLARDVAGTAADITSTYGYNAASQMVSETRSNDAYAYTGRANISRAYTANGLNQYATVGAATYAYDITGNLTCDNAYVYRYDVENRLVEKRAKVGASCTDYSGAAQAVLRYDPMGRLYETVGSITGTTRYLYDGDALVAEYNAAGTLLRRYVHGAQQGVDDPVAWYEGSAMNGTTLRYLHADRQGSISLVGDSAGNAVRIFSYDEYGIPQSGDGATMTPANGARFMYTGQVLIPDLGMYHYKARMYSPSLGRFMQTDPIGYEDQINLYAYVANDPMNGKDPTGMKCAHGGLGSTCVDDKSGDALVAFVEMERKKGNYAPPSFDGGIGALAGQGANMAATYRESQSGMPMLERLKDGLCDAAAEGGTPVELLTAAAGAVVGQAVDDLTSGAASKLLRRARIAAPAIGSTIMSTEARMAIRGRRAGLIGAAAGFGVGYFFGDEVEDVIKEAGQMCKIIF